MSRKAVETTRNISNTSGAGSANKCTVQWWFQTFFKGNESLEGECGDWPQKLTITNWEPSSKLILLQLQEKLLKNSTLTILQSFSIWSELERWKSLISGCLIACKKKIVNLKCHLLFYTTTVNHFLIRLWCEMNGGFYTTTSDNQLSGWTKKQLQSTFQSQTCTKKKVLCHRLVVCCQSDCSFLNPSRSITSEKYAQQIRCTENCSTCSQHWWAEWAQFSTHNHPTAPPHIQLFTSWTNWLRSYASSTTFTWPLANQPPLQGSRQLFAGKMLP